MGWSEPVPKRVRQKIRNCHAAYVASVENPVDWNVPMKGLETPHRQVPSSKRYRRRGNQGRLKGALLSHFLLQWFIDWRKNVSGRVWPKTVLKKAIQIKGRIREWYRDHGKTCPEMPFLDTGKRGKRWLCRWRAQHHISFRKCKRKFKVSKDHLHRRCRLTWLNSWAAMLVYNLLFKTDRERIHLPAWPYKTCRDQKGIMLNESESVNACTMNFEGCEDGIKTNHGQSRIRVSLWTSMSDDPDPDNLEPLQLCYKLKTDRNTKKIVVPPGGQITCTYSPSGSYNYEATMRYLEKHVPVWTKEREEKRDYRIMYLDDFAVHKMEEVKNFLWSRGFLRVLIGGGCTFILCNPDLDMHADIERQYLEMDIEFQASELERRPWKVPEKDRQTFANDMVSIWDTFPHKKRGQETFKLCGLGARPPQRVFDKDGSWKVPLSGPDDWKINRDASVWFWIEDNNGRNMQKRRQMLLERIYTDFDAGKITEWDHVHNYQDDFSDSENGGDSADSFLG